MQSGNLQGRKEMVCNILAGSKILINNPRLQNSVFIVFENIYKLNYYLFKYSAKI